jgi:hypothetical protein
MGNTHEISIVSDSILAILSQMSDEHACQVIKKVKEKFIERYQERLLEIKNEMHQIDTTIKKVIEL